MNKYDSRYIQKQFSTNSKEYAEWFGYYNYDVLSRDCSKMLCNRASFDGVAPQKGMVIELGYYDLETGEWNHIDYSDSWNWQQGAMLQWLPGEGNETRVIYNTSDNNHIISKIYDIETKQTQIINYSIYGITPDGQKSIALEMERSRWCRAYHYKSIENTNWDGDIVEADGIFEVDLNENTRRRIIAIQDVITIDADPDFLEKKHWLEHIMISPNGRRFCFLHRFSNRDNVLKYTTRLCVADIDGSNLQVIEGWRMYSWSHFGWKSDEEFVIYTVKKPNQIASKAVLKTSTANKLKSVIYEAIKSIARRMPVQLKKRLKGKINFYQYYKLVDGQFRFVENWDNLCLDIDGHPSFTKDGRYMITDSYPDYKQKQRLIIFDTETHKGIIVGKFHASYMGNPASCDLHPKLCQNNEYLVIDTAYDRKHHMLKFRLDWPNIQKKISR